MSPKKTKQEQEQTKLAFITGAGSGIGYAISKELDKAGYRLIISGSNPQKLERLADELGHAPSIEICDLSDRDNTLRLCEKIQRDYGGIDVAFINAGVVVPGDFCDRSIDSIDRELDINLRSALYLIQSCIPAMKQRQKGHIIATSSIGGIMALQGSAVYSATKFALRGFLSALHQELKQDNIKVSGLYPGAIDTPMLRHEALNNGSPLNFLGTPKSTRDVAQAFMKTLENGNLETYIPYSDSLTSRLLGLIPGAIPKLTPSLMKQGEKGRRRFIKNKKLE